MSLTYSHEFLKLENMLQLWSEKEMQPWENGQRRAVRLAGRRREASVAQECGQPLEAEKKQGETNSSLESLKGTF